MPAGYGVAMFEVAANPDPDSTLPFLIRLPLPDGELILKARDSWLRTAKVYCHRAEGWPEQPQIIEQIPVRACRRRGVAIDLVLDRPRENRSQLVFTRIQGGREGIFWQSARTTRQARPGIRVPRRRAAELAHLTILIDTRERYPYKFAHQQASTERRALPAGDYGIAHDGEIVAVVERKTLDDLVRRVIDGWFASDFASEVWPFVMPSLRGCRGYDGEREAAQASAALAAGEVGDLSGGHLAGALAVRRGPKVERRREHGGQAQSAGEGRGVGRVRGVEARRPVALAGAGRARGGAGGERQAFRSVEGDGGGADPVPGKAALGLFGPVPARVSAETKLELLGLIDSAVGDGWSHARACRVLELVDERAHRWRARLRETGTLEDRGPGGGAVHGLLEREEQAILDLIETWGSGLTGRIASSRTEAATPARCS
jgi:ERCC4 domain-containing protein